MDSELSLVEFWRSVAIPRNKHSAVATVTQLTEEDRKLARDVVSIGIQKLVEAQNEKPA